MTAANPSSPTLRSSLSAGPGLRSHLSVASLFPPRAWFFALTILLLVSNVRSQSQSEAGPSRTVSGVVLNDRNEAVSGASITTASASGTTQAVTDGKGNFRLRVPSGAVTLNVSGNTWPLRRRS
jgi:hypothetical protein